MEGLYTRLAQFSMPAGSLSLGENGALGGIRHSYSQLKGFRDFFDLHRMSRPAGPGDAQGRISFNLRYFWMNYVLIASILLLYALLTNLLLLFVLVVAVVGFWGISKLQGADLVLPGGVAVSQQSLYILVGIITVPLFFIASPMATVFWLLGAAGATILGHAVLLEKPLESEFEETV